MKYYLLDKEEYRTSARLVGEVLLDELSRNDVLYLTNAELMDMTGLPQSTLFKALKTLKASEVLKIEYCLETNVKIISLGKLGQDLIAQNTQPVPLHSKGYRVSVRA